MQAANKTSSKVSSKASGKGFSLQPIFWIAGVALTLWYLTPANWYSQPTRVQVDSTYRPAARL